MNNEEKIIAMLEEIKSDVSLLTDRYALVEEDISSTKRTNDLILSDVSDIKHRLETVERVTAQTAEKVDHRILPALNDMGEVQSDILQQLKSFATKENLSDVKTDYRLLATVVAQNTREIEELKQAQ